ncbi:MAG: hypothetical protein A2566_02020 [Candidatus Zambryskibacteria bacterium RIFOXYD1_FULL_40_13]|nr:MAG: hypothetical protein A2566_02020 [Candidatus Zambryskibacteria bacterium RIFOXYD1_FULL_40_13]HBD25156.1 hypothetical protein [Candidatus Zambryskibacteria bacterium]HBO17284.1 hypothetical protein [Candidatus Zambryskibacteria bacterium]HBZ04101.1 hypothetical protein [Candidatus Zambryskibacteria bacterium]
MQLVCFTFFHLNLKTPRYPHAMRISREKKGWDEPVGQTVFCLWEYFQVTGQSDFKKTAIFSGFFGQHLKKHYLYRLKIK